jgi:hypothetical protein
VGAVAVAAVWAVFFFGIIDLLVAIIPSDFPDFMPFVILETSWGLLYTFLLPVPLIAWAVRPVGWVGPRSLGSRRRFSWAGSPRWRGGRCSWRS